MIAYSYDTHGHLIGQADCQLDPVETEKSGQPVYLIPAMATGVEPPAPASGKIAVWTGKAWQMKADTRGNWYKQSTGELVTIETAGEPVTGLTRKEPPKDFRRVYDLGTDSWIIRPWTEMPAEEQRAEYERQVSAKIRARYTADQEQALKSDALAGDTIKLTDFLAYREQCKQEAREAVYGTT